MKIARLEQQVFKHSILVTTLVAVIGIAFGMLSGAMSIIFDGVFSAIDASMSILSLVVVRLLTRDGSRRFQHGFWHIEPLVLTLNGCVLVLLCFYAFINAVTSLLDGGRELAFDWAIVYSVIVCATCYGMYFYERQANRRVGSELIMLDIQSWLMSGTITLALLLAFITGFVLNHTSYSHLTPYVDPAILAVLTLCLLPMPVMTVVRAIREVLLITPQDLDSRVGAVMEDFSRRYQFEDYSYYAMYIGRGLFVEIHIVLSEHMRTASADELDDLREEISDAIGEEGNHRWFTVSFTRDKRWIG